MFKNYLKPAPGRLLIANPFLPDPNFQRTVILITEYSDSGTVGFVVNKPLDIKVHDAIHELVYFPGYLHLGGPVQLDSLHFVHTLGQDIWGGEHLGNDITWSGNFDSLKKLFDSEYIAPTQIKFFVGYSGWSAGQLEEELASNSWIVSESSADLIFCEDPAKLWQKSLRLMGGEFAMMSNFPSNPRLN